MTPMRTLRTLRAPAVAPTAAVASLLLFASFLTLAVPQTVAQAPPPGDLPRQEEPSLSGVLLSEAGSPLGGAVVTVHGEGTRDERQQFPTGHDGRFFFHLGAGSYNLSAQAPGHGETTETVVVTGAVPAQQDLTLPVTGHVLRGKVISMKTGDAVGDALLEFHLSGQAEPCPPHEPCPVHDHAMPEYYRMPLSTRTAEDGTYAVGVPEGTVHVRAWRDGFRESWSGAREIAGDTTIDLQLTPIPPKSAVLTGQVVDKASGRAIASAWVHAWPTYETEPADGGDACHAQPDGREICEAKPAPAREADYREGNRTQTNREGRFRMAMHPGAYQVEVHAEGYGQFRSQVRLADGGTFTLNASLERIPGDTVTILGTVTDRATGEPVAYAWVNVENPEWGAYQHSQADAQGRFELRTKPGYNVVWVRADNRGYTEEAEIAYAEGGTSAGSAGTTAPADGGASDADDGQTAPSSDTANSSSTIAPRDGYPREYRQPEGSYYPWTWSGVLADGATQALDAKLKPRPKADVRIVGYVVNATSQEAVAGAQVNFHNEDTGDWGWARTDANGSFVLMGRAGMHTVHAYADGYFQNAVMVEVRGPETRVDVVLQPGHSRGYCCWAYAEEASMAHDTAAGGGESMAPGAPAPSSAASRSGDGDERAAAGGLGSTGPSGEAATYRATGESLGPYDPSKAPIGGTSSDGGSAATDDNPRLDTPGVGLVAALGALVLAGAVLRRRRNA